jgi:hypothetical protein
LETEQNLGFKNCSVFDCKTLSGYRYLFWTIVSYWEIALVGHADTQLPHSMQTSASTFALPPSIVIASTGQVPTQASHPAQAVLSTTAFAMTSTS